MDWMLIPGFDSYYVCSEGIIVNARTGREMVLSPTENGDLTVGMMSNGFQHRRSVKVIVAKLFVEGETPIFDTPVLLDGDQRNLNAENIVWRPRWFAWKYTRQFSEPFPEYYDDGPIIDVTTNTHYDTVLMAAVINGLLCFDVYESIVRTEPVFPTSQIFCRV